MWWCILTAMNRGTFTPPKAFTATPHLPVTKDREAMAKKAKVVELSLESILWNCRNALRGTVGGNEKNRDAVMGLVFLKIAGDKFEKRRAEIQAEHGDIPAFLEKDSFCRSKNVFYLTESARWSHIAQNASANDIAVRLDTAMADIEDRNPPLKGALPQRFYATLGTRKEQLKSVIDEINKIDEARFHEKDLIGRVYEYFLQVFAIDSGQGGEKGEVYTTDGGELPIRKQLLESDKVEAIIVLPREMFYSTDISVTLWLLNNNKAARKLNGRKLRDRRGEVLFVDLRRWNENIYEKSFVQFSDAQIATVKQLYDGWQTGEGYADTPELCKSATLEEIRAKKNSLAPSKYITFIDHDLEIDYAAKMKRIQKEMRDLLKAEKQSQALLETAFGGIGYAIK